jgi:hypothetical protein
MAIDLYSKASTDTLLAGKLSISSLSNGATSTLNSTAPTTGQALTFDGTDLVWATGGGSFNGGAIANPITIAGSTYDSEMSSDYFGVELSSDHTQYAELTYNTLIVASTAGNTQITPSGITFPDSTTQTTAGWIIGSGDLSLGGYSLTNGNVDCSAGFVTAQNITLTSGGVLTFPDSTTQTTAATGADPKKAIANLAAACLVFDNYTPQIIFMGPFGYSVAGGKYSSGNQYQLGIGTIGSTPTAFTLSSSNDSAGHMIAVSGAWGSYFGQSIAYSDDYGTTWTYSDLII